MGPPQMGHADLESRAEIGQRIGVGLDEPHLGTEPSPCRDRERLDIAICCRNGARERGRSLGPVARARRDL